MRIIAGKYKRTPLYTLEGELTRPTRDMVKEALFSSVEINDSTTILDLFSGSGAIGLEALSRGAKDAVFNDMNKDAVKVINANLDKVKEKRTVLCLDYKDCLKKLCGHTFSFIYIDPPYKLIEYENMLKLIEEYDMLTSDGIIVIEVRKDVDLNEEIGVFKQYKIKKYGINKLLYYRRKQ